MKRWLLVFAISAAASAQVAIGLGDGRSLVLTTSSDRGASGSSRIGSGVAGVGMGLMHRVVRDASGEPLFGYDIEVHALAGNQYQILVAPLSPEYERKLGAARKVATFGAKREAAIVGVGDKAVIDLLVNPSNGERISDNLEIVEDRRGGGFGGAGGAVTAASGGMARAGGGGSNVAITGASGGMARAGGGAGMAAPEAEMQLWGFTASKNGQQLSGMDGKSGVVGDALMFYIPGEGGFFFSAKPTAAPGFLNVGAVNGNLLAFTWNGDRYEVVSTKQILTRSYAGEVWVYHDPAYRPKPLPFRPGAQRSDSVQSGACGDAMCWFSKNE
jgi:hypothetical protein